MPAHPEPAAIRWHAEVAQAVQAGDAAAAERAMRDIVDEATRAMLAPSDAGPPAPPSILGS
jgi:DNA-binding FadR family transcriptional regulator